MATNNGSVTIEEDNIITEIKNARDEAFSAWKPAMENFYEDDEFYMSKQWDAKLKAQLEEKGVPALVLNYIKKTVDMVSGYQRQNKVDLRARPIESADEVNAEVKSRLLKWILSDTKYGMADSATFKDKTISGLGWFDVSMDYSRDMLDGDIVVRNESKYAMKVDPNSVELDLSDAEYVIREKNVSRKKLMNMYPKKKAEIKKAPTAKRVDDGYSKEVNIPDDRGNKVRVTEYWYRDYEMKTLLVDSENFGDIIEHDGSEEELDSLVRESETLEVIRKEVVVIKLAILLGDNILVYDGDHPEKMDRYPFFPSFGFYMQSNDMLDYKIQGIVRSMKDAQREKNVRRSQLLRSVGHTMRAGYLAEKGAVDDINALKESAGYDSIIEYNPGKRLEQKNPPPIDSAVVQIEMMFNADLEHIGATPDMLGQITERGASGVTVNARLKQGLTTIQEIFDNHYFALQIMGEYIVDLMDKNFSVPKIKRILGNDLPFAEQKKALNEQAKKIQAQAPIMEQQIQQLRQQGAQQLQGQQQQDQMWKQAQAQALDDYERAEDKGVADGIYDGTLQMQEQQKEEQKAQNQAQTAQYQQQEAQIQQQTQQMQMQMQAIQQMIQEIEHEELEFWAEYEATIGTARYDIVVDETASSPTYRMSAFQDILQASQYGVQIPPESVVELMDIPKSTKEKVLEQIERNKQMQEQMMAQQQNSQQAKNVNRVADAQAKR